MAKTRNLFGLFMIVLLLSACDKDESMVLPGDELSDGVKKGLVIAGEEIHMVGTSTFYCYCPKNGKVYVDLWLPCEATLVPIEGQKYILKTKEIMPPEASGLPVDMYRFIDFEVKMSPSGVIKTCYPETWYEFGNDPSLGNPNTGVLDQVLEHTGCDLSGPGIVKETIIYTGKFDGELLDISCHFVGKQVSEPSMPFYVGLEGPAMLEFGFHFEVVD